jgi:hypothetical protein
VCECAKNDWKERQSDLPKDEHAKLSASGKKRDGLRVDIKTNETFLLLLNYFLLRLRLDNRKLFQL